MSLENYETFCGASRHSVVASVIFLLFNSFRERMIDKHIRRGITLRMSSKQTLSAETLVVFQKWDKKASVLLESLLDEVV